MKRINPFLTQFITVQLFSLLMTNDCSFSQNSRIPWSSLNIGFSESKTSNTLLKSAVGQSFVGKMQSANTEINSGFLVDTLFASGTVSVEEPLEIPTSFALDQNYPNPFNPTTTIRYALPQASHVTLNIYSVLGQVVEMLIDCVEQAGNKSIEWNASIFPSGVYFYRLQADGFIQTKKLILMK